MQVADILADVCAPAHAVDSDRAARLQAARHRPGRRRRLHRQRAARSSRTWCSSKQRTGNTVTLGLEPEPRCYLETTDETIAYFQDYLYTGTGRAAARDARRGADGHARSRPCGAISA